MSKNDKNKLSAEELYNHSALRYVNVLFGTLFSRIFIRKYNEDGTINEKEKYLVPIVYSNKTAYAIWLEQKHRLPDNNIPEVNTQLPRMSFEMSGLSVEPERGMNTNLPIYERKVSATGKTLLSRTPISYSFSFSLSIWCKQMVDSIQILDQILPMFTPELSLKVKESAKLNIVNDVRFVLTGVNKSSDDYENQFSSLRIIQWNLEFTVYADIMPYYTEESTVISEVLIDTVEATTESFLNGIEPPFMNEYGIKEKESAENGRIETKGKPQRRYIKKQ